MKKLLVFFLSIILNITGLIGQAISGNYELDSLVVTYITVVRDTVQTSPTETTGQTYVTTYDKESATYNVKVGWPNNTNPEFTYELPYHDIGDTIGVLNVPLGSSAALAAFGLGLNVDFDDVGFRYSINEGSVYPTTNTVDCITDQVFLPIQDIGDWTNGGYGPLIDADNLRAKWGWGIITSGVFATFDAPDMVNDVLGVDYGLAADGTPTAMPNWGYLQANYDSAPFETPIGLNIGWRAHDSKDANLGIVSDGDPFYVQAEADLGLLNGMVGRAALPTDSVSIGGAAQYAAALDPPITINVPDKPYMFGGEGVTHPTTGDEGFGAFDTTRGYIFDPTGDLIGGGDGELFSGDEGLAATGYFATWNTIRTLNAITYGAGYGIATGAQNGADFASAIMNAVYEQWYLDTDSLSEIMVPIDDAGNTAPGPIAIEGSLAAKIDEWVTLYITAGMPPAEATKTALGNVLPVVLGGLATLESIGPGLFEDWDGDSVYVNDSDTDLESEYWWWFDNDGDGYDSAADSIDIDGNPLPRFNPATGMAYGSYSGGGRIFVETFANCWPARWSQYVDSHWTYMGESVLSNEDDNITVEEFALKGNYPNPFNPVTKIKFSNDRNDIVKITVFSLMGEKVATIMNKNLVPGTYDVSWNGRNTSGQVVPTGMYFYKIESGGRSLQGKMLFLK